MASSHQLISAPNIYLFAFQQQQEFFSRSSLTPLCPDWSIQKYSQILDRFHVCQKIKLNFDTDNNHLVNKRKNNPQSLTQPQKFLGTIKTQENLELIQGEAYPNYIDKTHIISLKINRQKQNQGKAIDIEQLASFNPKNCFSPRNIKTNLGQTVMITALVNNRENMQINSLKSLANNYVSSFAHLSSSWQEMVLIDSSIIANGYFSTYYLPGNSPQYNQIIVGLFFRQKDRDNFQKYYREISEFLLSLHKLTYVHQYSSNLFKLAFYQIDRLKHYLKTFNNDYITQVQLPNNTRENYSLTSIQNSLQNKMDWCWQESSLSKIDTQSVAVFS